MKGSARHKLSQLILTLILTLFGLGILILMLTYPAKLIGITQTAVLGGAMAGLFWVWRRRIAGQWRYAVTAATTLTVVGTFLLLLSNQSLTQVAQARMMPETNAANTSIDLHHVPLLQTSSPITVTTLEDELNSDVGDGDCSLREAIVAANTNVAVDACSAGSSTETDIIVFSPVSATGTINLAISGTGEDAAATGDLDITEDLSIVGLGESSTIIDGGDIDRVFHVPEAVDFEVQDLTIRNGKTNDNGGGIYHQANGDLGIIDTIIESNESGSSGGGIAKSSGGTVTIQRTDILNNQSVRNGGGIYYAGWKKLTIKNNSSVQNNQVIGSSPSITATNARGGGLANLGSGTVDVINTDFINNESLGAGGGLTHLGGGVVSIKRSDFLSNTVTALDIEDGQNLGGGAIAVLGSGPLEFFEGTIHANTAIGDGGGVVHNGGSLVEIGDQAIVSNNETEDDGGGVAIVGPGSLAIFSSTVMDNKAGNQTPAEENANGGGIFTGRNSNVVILTSSIVSNTAQGAGGGIFTQTDLTILNSTFSANDAVTGNGGGINNFSGGITSLNNVTIANNSANSAGAEGGGIFDENSGSNSNITLKNSIVADNSAATDNDDCFSTGEPIVSEGYNLVETPGDCEGELNGPGDITGQDPRLGPLQDNDGSTETHALLIGSPAVDAGSPTSCDGLQDQRGTTRQDQSGVGAAGVTCDIGAFDFDPVLVPELAIDDVDTEVEGNSETKAFIFTVSMNASIDTEVTVDYSTADGTNPDSKATIDDNDYVANSGTITFAPNDTTDKEISVTVNGDDKIELNETFFVNLSNSSWATLADSQGQGLIRNDDDPNLSISDIAFDEGDSGTTSQIFTFTLSAPIDPAVDVSFTYILTDDTAIKDEDYEGPFSGFVMFDGDAINNNNDNLTRKSRVYVKGDTTIEPDETLFIKILNPDGIANINMVDDTGLITIIDDDTPRVAVNDVSVTEGNEGTTPATFEITLSKVVQNQAIVVEYETKDGTAKAGQDYVATNGQVTFPQGDNTPKTVEITVNGDEEEETDEDFFIEITNVTTGVNLYDAEGKGTILDDDTVEPPSVEVYLPLVLK